MEIKRQPYRVLYWHRSDCADVQDAVGCALDLIDKEFNKLGAKEDEDKINRLAKCRATLHSLLVAAVEL